MRYFKGLWVMLAVAGLNAGAVYAQEAALEEALPNIYCLVPQAGDDANSAFITTGQGVIVIDTRNSPEGGGKVLKVIRETTEQPVAYVINSHFHKENISGNAAFKSVPTIIAHRKSQPLMFEQAEEENRQLTPPNVTFKKQMELKLGQYHLHLIHPGPAHTEGDLYVYIPKWRIIITGGLVYNRIIPYLGDSNIQSWIRALQQMEDLDAEVIVPGHGRVGGKPLVTQIKHYLMELTRFVNDALDARKNLPETLKRVKEQLKPKYSGWAHFERIDENIVRAYVELNDKRGR
ncbi:MAG: MBL fold metallo-hydrolase [Nitrospinaceae bacterium]|nr:MBL fold metallo-hydrolase [Nitrospinaceae bacterium]NIR54000.1 MBL fold metallo-hydrolase [Nitrospinaceae bacterium]NIS84419.1 MBL fold metallo-hydrolase [Nitrospinaceae bacterium]NIT81210.1 MBL fold metallo-hydrolase [Nitrospinaceae bacterium]NIU43499.1 MBL fold metallo-hydrolase [Nitrospinaceae bacterium]